MILLLTLLAAATQVQEEAAIFKAAGFSHHGETWRSGNCDAAQSPSYEPGRIATYKDINHDGRPDAVVTEGGAICYGDAGSRFWLLSKQPTGAWKLMMTQTGVPIFYTNSGRGGWPHLSVGGPGLCFPVYKWNGRQFELFTFEYEGKRCKGPQ